jgi:hypothetical protein
VKRNVLTDPAPHMVDHLDGIEPDGKVNGYPSTYYLECESIDVDENGYVRVVLYGNDAVDFETRIPFDLLQIAGFHRGKS